MSRGSPRSWHPAWSGAVFLALACAWTWPALLGDPATLVGRQFDLPGTAWVIDAAPRLLRSLHDPLTGWPAGSDYDAPDSLVLLVLGAALHGIGAVRLHSWLQVLGVALSAWAAEGFARALGARTPWSLLAGLGFAFSGLATTALLEGHVYHLLDPWMPLFAWSWWIACSPRGRVRHGLAAGACWALCLASTAYLGLAASVLALAFLAAGLLRGTLSPGPVLAAAAIACGAGLVYLLTVAPSSAALPAEWKLAGLPWALYAVGDSAHLAALAPPLPEVDRTAHSVCATLPSTVLALALAAPVVLGRSVRWRGLALGAALSLLLAMGPRLGTPGHTWLPLPLAVLDGTPAAAFFRFPARIEWGTLLCLGALASLVATRLSESRPRAALLLLPLALFDSFHLLRMPERQRRQIAGTPSAELVGHGPLLDLFPEEPGRFYELEGWFQAWACEAQIGHRRPIADDCVVTRTDANPRVVLEREILPMLLDGRSGQVAELLRRRRFQAVALHPDLFRPGDRAAITASLERLDPRPISSTDAGDHVLVYRVPG